MRNQYYTEFRRGDVWYIKLNSETGDNNDKSSVQKKSRPYVIVSCEENNNCAPIINVVPISTQTMDHLPMHVYYRGYNRRDQMVMCEQITTLSVLDFRREGSYFMYSLNVEYMNKVDEALAGQLGLTTRVADMTVLEKIVDKLAADKEAKLKEKYEAKLEARVSEIAEKLAKKFGIDLSAADMINGLNYRPEQLAYVDKGVVAKMNETIEQRTTPPVETPTKPETSDKKKKRENHKWTDEAMRAFLEDYKHLSISAMSSKWGMAKKSVATYASLFRKKVEEMVTGDGK